MLGPTAARVAVGAALGAEEVAWAGCTPSLVCRVSRVCCSGGSCAQLSGCFCRAAICRGRRPRRGRRVGCRAGCPRPRCRPGRRGRGGGAASPAATGQFRSWSIAVSCAARSAARSGSLPRPFLPPLRRRLAMCCPRGTIPSASPHTVSRGKRGVRWPAGRTGSAPSLAAHASSPGSQTTPASGASSGGWAAHRVRGRAGPCAAGAPTVRSARSSCQRLARRSGSAPSWTQSTSRVERVQKI